MSKQTANERKNFFGSVEKIADEVENWSEWKKSGIGALRFDYFSEHRTLYKEGKSKIIESNQNQNDSK